MKPNSLVKLISSLNALPGIGKKQAERIAYYIVNDDSWISDDIMDALSEVKKNIIKCDECGNITEENPCYICNDKDRLKKLIVVETPLDVFKFEESGKIKAYYHVLNGLVNIQKNINPEDINIDSLIKRSEKYNEVILALSPNLEGLVTSNYISNILSDKTKVTQLAQGIPLGAAMEYVDEITLNTAIENRKEIK